MSEGPQVHVRMPPRLHERVKEIAEVQDISMNQAIVLLLTSATGGFQFSEKGEE